MYGLGPSKMSMSKRITALALVLLMSIPMAVGCGPKESMSKQRLKVTFPVKLNYLVVNPIELKPRADQTASGAGDHTITISGLKDKAVEAKINKRLESLYTQLKNAPIAPYRGIKVRIPDGATLVENQVHSYATFNYNNLLSVVATNHRAYKASDQDYPNYYTVIETVNLDLRTGNEITLQDIFTDDTDGLKLLSERVKHEVTKSPPGDDFHFWGGPNLKLITPFTGIRAGHKFNLSSSGLTLIFDYKTPEFETHFYPISTHIFYNELGPVFAIAQRFQSKVSIYESTAGPVKELLQGKHEGFFMEGQEKIIGKVTVHSAVSWPKEVDPSIKNLVMSKLPSAEDLARELNARREGATSYFLCQHLGVRWVGPYLAVHYSQSISGTPEEWQLTTLNYCFDENNKQLALSDLFVAGFDYESAITAGIDKAMRQFGIQGTYQISELLGDLQFALGNAEVTFYTRPINLNNKGSSGGTQPLAFSIPFTSFGCDNLAIFR